MGCTSGNSPTTCCNPCSSALKFVDPVPQALLPGTRGAASAACFRVIQEWLNRFAVPHSKALRLLCRRFYLEIEARHRFRPVREWEQDGYRVAVPQALHDEPLPTVQSAVLYSCMGTFLLPDPTRLWQFQHPAADITSNIRLAGG